jgi:DNA-binding transcriptional ArsR family regulator
MITIRLDSHSVSKIRLSTSPLTEVAAWLHLTSTQRHHVVFGDTGSSARFALRDREVRFASQMLGPNAAGYALDLLFPKPPPGGPDHALDGQLQVLRGTPPEAVEEQLTTYYGGFQRIPRDVHLAVEADRFTERLTNGLQRFWRTSLVDQYGGLEDLVMSDLGDRARAMAQGGVGQMLNNLHPKVGWVDNRLEVYSRYAATLDLVGVDLVVAPAVLALPYLQVTTNDPDNMLLTYPVAGMGRTPRSAKPALSELVGASRARILRDLGTPRSTIALSKRHRLAASTVSHHLGVLLAAGLVRRTRRGATVQYWRGERGDALVRTPGSAGPAARHQPRRAPRHER